MHLVLSCRGLLEAIEGLVRLTNMSEIGGINKNFGLDYINVFIEMAMKKCSRDI